LQTATNYAGTVTLAYDNRGRLQSETDVFGKVISYGYTETSSVNRKTVTFEGSLYETYDFDDANRLTSITDNASGVYSFAYDVANKMTTTTRPNNVTTTYEYDGLSRLTRLKHTTSPSVIDYNYAYNTASQITG
jgi:YD repeat-containing protein